MTENPRDSKPQAPRRPRLRLPFDNRREDAGTWAYDHRIGLCVTLIAYLALMIVFVSSKIVVGARSHQQGMYVDLQSLAELEQEKARLEREVRERRAQEEIDWRSIRNQASNENALNEKLRDDRGTNAAALNQAAAEAVAEIALRTILTVPEDEKFGTNYDTEEEGTPIPPLTPPVAGRKVIPIRAVPQGGADGGSVQVTRRGFFTRMAKGADK